MIKKDSSLQIYDNKGYNKELAKGSCNILENLSKADYKRVRSMMINLVLATDMSKHFSELGKLKARIGASDFDPQ
jgi:3',5'-cyclic-nucleotide phosphodiesterase